ncbi:MAG: hypothetical protein AB1762_08075 [Gemmatimonadota bacterium]
MTTDLILMQAEQPPPTPQAPQAPPTREQLRQQIQDAIQAARDAAIQAQQDAQAVTVQPPPMPPSNDVPEGVMVLVIVLAALTAATIIFGPLFRALGRRIDRRGHEGTPPDVIAPRLDRIEQAIEAMAVEVERISEGQRYVNKQVHELRALPAPNPLAEPVMAQRAAEPVRRGESGT